jgi:hypothetical protein
VSRQQGSLEYIIIIGGIIILAAASYFMLRGFSTTTAGETTETLGTIGEKFRLELENMGRSETRFLSKRWPSLSLTKLTNFSFSCIDDLVLNTTNLSGYGINTNAMAFYCFKGSDFCSLNHTIVGEILTVNKDPSCCKSPYTFYMFYNNSSSLTDPCSMNYTFPCTINVCTPPQNKTDTIPPHIDISPVGYIIPGEDAWVDATVLGTGSNLSLVEYSIDGTGWIKAHNIWYNPAGMKSYGRPHDGSWDENDFLIISTDITTEGSHNVAVRATDQYGNINSTSRTVSFVNAGQASFVYFSGVLDQDGDGIGTFSSLKWDGVNLVIYKNHSSPLNRTRGGGSYSFTTNSEVAFWTEDNFADSNVTLRYAIRTGETWTNPINITSFPYVYVSSSTFAVNGSLEGVLVLDYTNSSSGNQRLKYSLWDGNQFSQPIHFPWDDDTFQAAFPGIGPMNSTHLFCVYGYNCTLGLGRCVNYSIWDGSSWSTPNEILNETVVTQSFGFMRVDFANETEGLLVMENDNGSFKKAIYSHWNGTDWSAPLNITTQTAYNETNPFVLYDSLDQGLVFWTLDIGIPEMPQYVIYNNGFGQIQNDTDMRDLDSVFKLIQAGKGPTFGIIGLGHFLNQSKGYARFYNWDPNQLKFIPTPTVLMYQG